MMRGGMGMGEGGMDMSGGGFLWMEVVWGWFEVHVMSRGAMWYGGRWHRGG